MNLLKPFSQKKQIGNIGEHIAADFLRKKGYFILERNFRIRYGEIDLICKDGKTIVFVEVKTRTNHTHGFPEEAVTWQKIKELVKTSEVYIMLRHLENFQERIDVIAIDMTRDAKVTEIRHHKNIM